MAEDDAAFGEVIRRHFDFHFVAGEDADVVFSHPPGDVGVNHVAVFQLNTEGGVREGFHHGADHFDVFFFGH